MDLGFEILTFRSAFGVLESGPFRIAGMRACGPISFSPPAPNGAQAGQESPGGCAQGPRSRPRNGRAFKPSRKLATEARSGPAPSAFEEFSGFRVQGLGFRGLERQGGC